MKESFVDGKPLSFFCPVLNSIFFNCLIIHSGTFEGF